jgi:hypothetical protein
VREIGPAAVRLGAGWEGHGRGRCGAGLRLRAIDAWGGEVGEVGAGKSGLRQGLPRAALLGKAGGHEQGLGRAAWATRLAGACFEGRPVEVAAAEVAVAPAFLELRRPQELAVLLEGLAILADNTASDLRHFQLPSLA